MRTTIIILSLFIAVAQAGKRGLAWPYCELSFFFSKGQFRTRINLQITRHLTQESSTTVTAKLWPYTIMRPTLPLPQMATVDLVLSACSAA